MEEVVKDIYKYLKRVARKIKSGDDICGAKEEMAEDFINDWLECFETDFEEIDLYIYEN